MSDTIEAAEAHVESMKKNFSLADVLADKVKYPTDTVDIFLDGDAAYKVIQMLERITDLRQEAELASVEAPSIAGSPEAEEANAKADELEKELEKVLEVAKNSMLTVTMSGIPSKVWRVIDAKARREFPDDKGKSQGEIIEQNIRRNEWVNIELVKVAIQDIKDVDGNTVDTGTITRESVEALYDGLYETEWSKLLELKDRLTFANALFDEVTAGDADFTLPSSPDEATPDTQN